MRLCGFRSFFLISLCEQRNALTATTSISGQAPKFALAVGDSSGQRQGELEVPSCLCMKILHFRAILRPGEEEDKMVHLHLTVDSRSEKLQ